MSVMLISVSHNTIVSNKHEEWTRHYYINFQHPEWCAVCLLQSHPKGLHLTDLTKFSLSILSYLTTLDFESWGDSLWELTYLMPFIFSQTHVCLMVNPILLNLTLFLTVHFRAMHGYAATHMHITHAMLLFHSATAMRLHHVFNLHYAFPRQYW